MGVGRGDRWVGKFDWHVYGISAITWRQRMGISGQHLRLPLLFVVKCNSQKSVWMRYGLSEENLDRLRKVVQEVAD